MSPNPLVVMAAPAPDTRYAPREMPRVGGRNEGRSFEQRLNQAEAKSKPGSTSKGVAESKPQEKPEVAAETSPKGEKATEEKVATTPEGNAAEQAIAVPQPPSVPVSELSSVTVMTAASPAPEAPAEEAPAEGAAEPVVPAQAVAPIAVAEGEEAADAALTAAVVKAVERQGKPETGKAEPSVKPAEEEAEEAEAEPAKAAVRVKPVATQTVPSTLDGLRAEKGLMSLRDSLDGAPRTETTPTPARTEKAAMPANLDEVMVSVVDEAAPEASSVKPWEISEPVRVAPEGLPQKSDAQAIKPEPVKEVLTRTFVQAQRTPDRPAELRLQLNPEHLGRMDVRVHAHEGAVSAVIRVEHAGVREMVESQLAALRVSLAEQGIKIDRLEVSVGQQGPRDQQAAAGFEFGRQAFGQDGQQEASGQGSQGHSRHTGWDGWALDDSDEVPVPEAIAQSGFDAQA